MRRPTAPAALTWEQAALIAQLAVHSTFPAEALETLRELLPQFEPLRIQAALDQAMTELEEEGRGPDFPAGDDADAYFMLHEGLGRLARLSPPASESSSFHLLAAA